VLVSISSTPFMVAYTPESMRLEPSPELLLPAPLGNLYPTVATGTLVGAAMPASMGVTSMPFVMIGALELGWLEPPGIRRCNWIRCAYQDNGSHQSCMGSRQADRPSLGGCRVSGTVPPLLDHPNRILASLR